LGRCLGRGRFIAVIRFVWMITVVAGPAVASESAISILFAGETKARAHFDEIDVQTLVSSTIFA